MIGLLGRMFGTERALEKIVDSASSAIDALAFTDEEKAEAAGRERAQARQAVVDWMRASQGQNITRRFIASALVWPWITMHILGGLILPTVMIWEPGEAGKINQSIEIIQKFSFDMNEFMWIIITFYFAAPHISEVMAGLAARTKQPGA